MAGAPLAHTPMIRVSGAIAFSQRATPEISEPSPICTKTVSNGPADWSSSPIVRAPSAISACSPSTTRILSRLAADRMPRSRAERTQPFDLRPRRVGDTDA
jgi:hypothetical protein